MSSHRPVLCFKREHLFFLNQYLLGYKTFRPCGKVSKSKRGCLPNQIAKYARLISTAHIFFLFYLLLDLSVRIFKLGDFSPASRPANFS